jgi:hypothetical protein
LKYTAQAMHTMTFSSWKTEKTFFEMWLWGHTKKQHHLQPNVLFQNQTFLHRRCHRDQTTTKWGKCIISFSSQIPIKLFSVFDWNIIILNLNAYHLDVDYEMFDCKKKMWSVKPLKANYAIRIVFCCCLQ